MESKKFKTIRLVGGKGYPSLLREIDDPPQEMFVMGTEASLSRFRGLGREVLAVVGARRMTNYGRTITQQLVREVVKKGVVVVSGLMYGVDEVAQRTAVASGGFTIGVWAGGIDTLRGTSREDLTTKVLECGVVVSEYKSGFAPQPWTFPQRNRIVAGMAWATLVTEAAERSGSLITAGLAAKYGREVLAVPGPVTSPVSGGVNYLIKSGARVVSEVEDILDLFGDGARG